MGGDDPKFVRSDTGEVSPMRDMPSAGREASVRAALRGNSRAPRLAKPPTLTEEFKRERLRIRGEGSAWARSNADVN